MHYKYYLTAAFSCIAIVNLFKLIHVTVKLVIKSDLSLVF